MNIKIRKAAINDLEDIQRLNQLLFIKEQREYDEKYNINWPYENDGIEYFSKELADSDRIVFLARDDNKAIGYLAASSEQSSKYINNMKIAELDNMFVLDDYRGKGIGTQLVKNFKNWAKEISAERLIVTASFGNQSGIDFYHKHGFEDFDIGLKIDR